MEQVLRKKDPQTFVAEIEKSEIRKRLSDRMRLCLSFRHTCRRCLAKISGSARS